MTTTSTTSTTIGVSNYGSTGVFISQPSEQNTIQVDPVVLAQAMQRNATQWAVNQNAQQTTTAPKIAHATAQQTLSLPEGQYVGDVLDGKPHGRGTLTYHPGRQEKKYEGEWQAGKIHGRGIFKWTSGARYEGEFKESWKEGEGIYFYDDGGKYQGSYIRNNRHGNGTMTYADGNKYSGEWKNNEYNGNGTMTYASGSKYSGGWLNGKQHGHGKYTYNDGDYYLGEWKDGKYHGQGKEVLEGSVREGIFRQGNLWTGTYNPSFGSPILYEGGIAKKSCCEMFCSIF